MINKLSKFFTDKMLANGNIDKEEQEIYIYGFFVLISNLLYISLVCIFGLIFQCFVESIIFYIAFQFTRKYAGGYHATTEARCEFLSTLSLVICIAMIKISKLYEIEVYMIILAFVSVVSIVIFSPIDTPEKPLSEKEFIYFRRISRVISIFILCIVVLSYALDWKAIVAPCCLALILSAVLLLIGKFKKLSS